MNAPQDQSAPGPKTSIPVAILGATGAVGQRFLALLDGHPWFRVERLFASEKSAGKTYREAVNWVLETPLPEQFAGLGVEILNPDDLGGLVVAFSALSSDVAGELETSVADAGLLVFSNAANHRMDPNVPLVVPEVNPDHFALATGQQGLGVIVTNPNCSTVGLVLALAPIYRAFGLRRVSVVSQQALSGAGLIDGKFMELEGNVIPYIRGEEVKLATEPGKLLGEIMANLGDGSLPEFELEHAEFPVSATCTRVPVANGHLLAVQVEFEEPVTKDEVLAAWSNFRGLPQTEKLPSAPELPVHYLEEESAPQPAQHVNLEAGMAASVGRLRPDGLFGEVGPRRRAWKFITLSHNTIRGAAGGSILNAELWFSTQSS
jgi:aspartate-semialdehyde dehydrogenase